MNYQKEGICTRVCTLTFKFLHVHVNCTVLFVKKKKWFLLQDY